MKLGGTRTLRIALFFIVALAPCKYANAQTEEIPPEAEPEVAPEEPPPPAPPPDSAPFLGRVLAKGDRQPMPGVTLFIDDDHTEITDDEGRFRFAALPPGNYTLKLRSAEIRPTETKLTIVASQQREVTYYVDVRQRYSTTVRAARVTEDVVVRQLSQDEIKHIPGTQGDTLKAVQNLPGVARAPFGGGALVVWGSNPQDTRVYTDGVLVPTLYHFGGLRSVVNSDMVDSLSFMPGGYGAEYGRGMGGVVEVATRNPKTEGYHGYAQIDLIDASLMVEGPITRKLSFAVAARRSLLDLYLPHLTGNNFQLTPVYYDYQLKLHYRPTPRDDLELFVFGSDDTLKITSKSPDPTLATQYNSHTYFHRFVGSWLHRFGTGATLKLVASTGIDLPLAGGGSFGNTPFKAAIDQLPWALRLTYHQPLARWFRFDAGLDYEGLRTKFNAVVPASGVPLEGDSTNTTSSYIADRGTVIQNNLAVYVGGEMSFFDKHLLIVPALRVELFSVNGYPGTSRSYSHSYVSAEPRLIIRVQANRWLAFKAAVGQYDQLPEISAYSIALGNPAVHPQSSWHYVGGVEFKPTSTLSIDLQGFYKDLHNLIVRGQTPDDPSFTNEGRGRVYGGELLIKQALTKNFYGWVSYTLSRSERQDHSDTPWRTFQYDQTHILTIVAGYMLPRGVQLGARFRYVTGNPYTPVVGAYFNSNADAYTPLNGPLYSGRLPAFHELDLRLDKTWTFNQWKLGVYLDIQNVYNYHPAEGYSYRFDFQQKHRVQGLPILPALGIRGDF